jgi:integrase
VQIEPIANGEGHVERYKLNSRERVLIAEEMARLGRAIASEPDGKVFLVIALTGARVSEITPLKRSYLDLDNSVARLPDSKTGAKTLVLPQPVVEILRRIRSLAGNEYVFPQLSKHVVYQIWDRIRTAAGLPDLRIANGGIGSPSTALDQVTGGWSTTGQAIVAQDGA